VKARIAFFLVAAIGIGSLPMSSQRQTDSKEPLTFDVASVKPTAPDERGGIVHQPPGGQSYEAIGAPLRTIMTVAYTVTDRQISGGPEWIDSERWNIEAKADRRGTSDELHAALARLLEDRFQLKIRHETRELPVYILTVDKKGPKMPVHDAADLLHEPIGGDGRGGLTGQNVTMNYFAFFLSRMMDLNVVDRTNLSEHYDVNFHFVRDFGRGPGDGKGPGDGGPPPVLPDGPDIYTALREQLGLQLQKGKGPVDYLVIEHVERPSAN
jgi:uncharacterized protein (TIGR03435 family)